MTLFPLTRSDRGLARKGHVWLIPLNENRYCQRYRCRQCSLLYRLRNWFSWTKLPCRLVGTQDSSIHRGNTGCRWECLGGRRGQRWHADCCSRDPRRWTGHASHPGSALSVEGSPSSHTRVLDGPDNTIFRHRLCHVCPIRCKFDRDMANVSCYSVGWISIACYHASDLTLSWRLPLALASVPPLALLAGLSFVSGKF